MNRLYIILVGFITVIFIMLVSWAAFPGRQKIEPPISNKSETVYNEHREDTQATTTNKDSDSELPKRIIVQGVWECLPHKDTSGPQTMGCAFGLAADQSDAHYALDLQLLASTADFPTGTRIEVEGIFTPANQLSSDIWQRYPIDGIISVTSVKKL